MKVYLACMYGGYFVDVVKLLDAFRGLDEFFVTEFIPKPLQDTKNPNNYEHIQYNYAHINPLILKPS